MKTYLLSMLLACSAATAGAQSLDYLTLRTADGSEQSIAVDGLKITFANGQLHAVAQGTSLSLPLASLGAMFFTEQPTAVVSLKAAAPQASIVGGRLIVTAPAGTKVRLYNADSRLLASYVKETSGTEHLGGYLAPGAYLVTMNGRTLKLLAK